MFGFHPDKKAPPAPQPKLGFRPRGQQQSAALAQAQNQAPDSIPGMFKPGEFVLPPDTVHAMGGPGALQAAVDATHTPAAEEAWVPRGFKPKVFFANGGRPEDQIPLGGQRAAPAPQTAGGLGYQQNNQEVGQSIKDSWNQGNYGEAVGKTVAGTVGMVTTPIIDLAARGSSAAWDGAKGFGRGLVGADGSPQAPNAAPPAVKASAPAVTPGAGAAAAARATSPSSNFAAVNEYSQAPGVGSSPSTGQASQISPGVFRSGNSYGDSEQAAILGAEPRGLPSWRNQNAANNLAGQQQAESMQRVQAAMAPPPTSPIQRVAIMGSGDARGFRRASNLRASDRGDLARLQEAQRYDTRMGFAAGQQQLERDRIAADTFRTARGFNVDQQRLDTERRLADSEITARGFKARAQRQEEQLRNTFLDPNATPQQRQQAQQSLRAINGEADPSQWALQVTPATKNADGSTTESSVYRINKATGDVQRVDGGQGEAKPLPPKAELKSGQVYQTARGAARWDGTQFVPIA